ncbi:uncharacterized protein N0V96_004824 [Colletotrichum fioriniae]|uniref:uncharacterized protein n=1 Tax=Colletotrichum fioriniae TaxID=710243 RepID=UPI0032DAF36B|nr:hypothetical protein N0V96_004824 [Colletotrichum fioriniae]
MANNLDSYISDRGGIAKLPEDGTTAPRVRLLKDAIEKADYFYIVLHQILCLWTLDTKAAHNLLGLPPDVTESALGIVQNVLRKNENMGQDTIFFFANFPASSASGLWHTEAYRNHIGEISRFLNNLHEQWNRILVPAMRPHSGRGYPILADELRYQLKLRSPILETIFFTVTRRHTGVPDGPIADQMNALFRQDSQNDQTQMSDEEQRVFQRSLISRYKTLVINFSNKPAMRSKGVPGPGNWILPRTKPRLLRSCKLRAWPRLEFNPFTITTTITPLHGPKECNRGHLVERLCAHHKCSSCLRLKLSLLLRMRAQEVWESLRQLRESHFTKFNYGVQEEYRESYPGPIATPAKNCVHRLAFVVPDEHFNKLCPTSNLLGDCVPVSEYFEGSLRYRLRLCELPVSPDEPANISESVWAVAQSYWPEHIAIMVNDNVVAVRRKQHNGQHLPVELTPYILPGTNSISVSISPKPAAQKPNMMYFMAVEVVETLSHDNIVNMVMSQGTISADTTKQVIRSRLEPVSSDGDDELVVVGSDLSIDLADPFSATIFKIPARGVSCTHMECFDLINWLETRPVKPRCTAHGAGDACRICHRGTEGRPEPSLVDKWKCPLCDGDARPYSLRVDRFMEDVRKSLEAEGKLHTKTIYVRADGMWKAKEEEADDDEEENVENRQPPAKRAKTRPSIPEPEIIELD